MSESKSVKRSWACFQFQAGDIVSFPGHTPSGDIVDIRARVVGHVDTHGALTCEAIGRAAWVAVRGLHGGEVITHENPSHLTLLRRP